MSRASWPRIAGASCVFSVARLTAAAPWPKASPQPSTPSSVMIRSQSVFMPWALIPLATSGVPPMS